LLGPFPVAFTLDYFEHAILTELTSVTEWIFFIAIMFLALVLYWNKTLHETPMDLEPRMHQKTKKFYGSLVGIALFVLEIAAIIITIWESFFNY